ncbi:MAG: hypothetical protein ABIR46_00395 [Candidatus Saccharimonadales bacterium]
MIKFRSVVDPVHAGATGRYDEGFGTFSQMPVGDLAVGAFDRFTEDFQNHVRRYFPDMIVGDDLTVYHLPMTHKEMSVRIRLISVWCTGWAGYDEFIESS